MKRMRVLMPSISGCSCDGKSSVNHGSACRERARPTPVAPHGRTMGTVLDACHSGFDWLAEVGWIV